MPQQIPQQTIPSIENNFTKGLITEFTGLNFPENAATDTQNCIYTLVGDVTRRDGFDYEAGFGTPIQLDRSNLALSDYKWNNVGGDGLTQIVVEQVGAGIYFFVSSNATLSNPLSTQKLVSTVNLNGFLAPGASLDTTKECTYSDGNGYLFVYHPNCNPIYCTYTAGTITATPIDVQIRDFTGVVDNLPFNLRPATLSTEHQYNLVNQGWISGSPWSAVDNVTPIAPAVGTVVFSNVASGISGISNGQSVTVTYTGPYSANAPFILIPGTICMSGTVVSYTGTTLTVNSTYALSTAAMVGFGWTIVPVGTGYINAWNTAVGNYPSNADVWWYFKNSSNVFDPATTVANVTLSTGRAPRGHYILSAFNQLRSVASGLSVTTVTTALRPSNGCWFQGRVFYTGVNAQQAAGGDANYYTWTENIYFSQVVQDVSQLGNCYQTNDPTSENLFDILPTDGGVISVTGSGSIYKLFPLQNALLVFAANGVWYITGSSGIGFAANDYTIVKLSSVRSISSTSFIDVQGLPMFWNEEGIYSVEAAKQGTSLLNTPLHVNPLEVIPITVGTILTYYNNIPLQSKKYVRGDYDPINYVVQWCFRSTNESTVTNRYQYDTIMNYNNYNKAFYPYTFPSGSNPYVHNVRYVTSPGGSTSPFSGFKYFSSNLVSPGSYNFTFSEERDPTFIDWASSSRVNFVSYFVTGFKLHGQGQRRFQMPYIYMYFRNDDPSSCSIQTLWDYATSGNSGRWSTKQRITNFNPNFGMLNRRIRTRGQGLVLQIKVASTDGQPFDIMGWSAYETQNVGV